MGASSSRTSVDLIVEAISNLSNEVVQKSIQRRDQQIAIYIGDVTGDVIINKLTVEQTAILKNKAMFETLTTQTSVDTINQQISQASEALISGINFGQLATSSSTVQNIIKNCITIKNKSISECSSKSNQQTKLTVEKVQGSVKLTDVAISQISETITDCVISNSSTTLLRRETDSLIKQISKSSTEGFDIKWIAIAGAVIVATLGVSGTIMAGKILGPGLFLGGIASIYMAWQRTKSNEIYDKNFFYTKNNIDAYYKLNFVNEFDYNNDSPEEYGSVDLYELFGKKIRLYNYIDKRPDFSKDISDIESTDVEKSIQIDEQNKNFLNLNPIEGSKKYIKTTKFPFDFEIARIVNKAKFTEYNEDYVILDLTDLKYTHICDISFYKNQKEIYYTRYNIEPTIIITKSKNTKSIFSDAYFIMGVGLLITGLILIIKQPKVNNIKTHK